MTPDPLSDEPGPSGMPAALAFVVFVGGIVLGLSYALWLASVQCIRIGGCG